MAVTRCTLITFLISSLLLQPTLAEAAPASSSKIAAFPLASVQGSESAATGMAEAKRRNLKGGGARRIGSRAFGSRGIGYRGGGGTRGIGSSGFRGHGVVYHAISAAVSLDHSLGMRISAVSVFSLIIIAFL